MQEEITPRDLEVFRQISEANAEAMKIHGDIVFVHDPQPVALIDRKTENKWIWPCHIDVSTPDRELWRFIRDYVVRY